MTQSVPRAPGALDDPALLGAILQRLRPAVHVCDADGRVLEATPGLATLLGAGGTDALRGLPFDRWVEDPASRGAIIAALVPGGPARDITLALRGIDGAARAVVETIVAVHGPDGSVQLHGLLHAAAGPDAASPEATAPGVERRAGRAGFTADREVGRDALTGCLERTHLHALGERLARDPITPVGVVIVRLLSDGVAPGERDALRQMTARFLMRQVRGNEPVIRLGDDEFLVVLGGASAEQVERVGRRVQLLALRGAPGPLSLGWAAREHGESLPAIVARASGVRVPVPPRESSPERRRGEEHTDTGPGSRPAAVTLVR